MQGPRAKGTWVKIGFVTWRSEINHVSAADPGDL